MRNFIIPGMIWLTLCCVYAGEHGSIPVKDIIIGRSYKSNADIRARRFDFPERIDRWSINDSTHMLTLQLRGASGDGKELKDTGNIVLVDLKGKRIIRNQQVDYSQSTIDQYDHVLIQTTGNKFNCLNSTMGGNMWSAKNAICYVNPAKMIGAGYKYTDSGDLTNSFEGIDLTTGRTLWKRTIKRDYHVNEVMPLNDSVIIVSANGLHGINLKTGQGWDYNARTGKKDYTGTVAANVFNLAFSILLGTEYEIVTGHDLITDVGSNTLIDSTGIYLADKESVVRLDEFGNVLWKSSLPTQMVSRSTLFIKDNLVCMVNDGFATYNNELTNYGKTFIAGFSKDTGKRVFLSKVGYNKEQILSYEIQKDTLFVLSKNRIFKYSLADGSELWEQPFKTDTIGELTQFSETGPVARGDSDTMKPLLTDSANVYVFNNKDQLLALDHLFNIKKAIPNDELYYCYLQTKGYSFIDNGAGTLVTNSKNKLLAELDISANTLLVGTKLYEVQGNSLVEIELKEIVNE